MLSWNVYYEDFNRKNIKAFNIFDHWKFWDDCVTNAKKNKDDKDSFAERLIRDLQYYFWSKCEWEIVLTSWPERKDFNNKKIDVYDQVCLNMEKFIDYVWENRKELKKKKEN